jgi:hypothetical protein
MYVWCIDFIIFLAVIQLYQLPSCNQQRSGGKCFNRLPGWRPVERGERVGTLDGDEERGVRARGVGTDAGEE